MNSPLVIPTERQTVILRQLTPEDAPSYLAAVEADRAHLSQFGDKTAEKYPDLKSVVDSITDPENPDKIRMGIWDGDVLVGRATLTPDKDGKATKMGYWVDGRFVRRGYATLAARALSEYGLQHFDKVYAHVATERTEDGVRVNEKSVGVLEKVGFMQTAREAGHLVFELGKVPSPETTPSPATREARVSDLPALKPILEHWIKDRNTGVSITQEVSDVIAAIEASAQGLNDRTYVVSEDIEGNVVGVMGMKAPDEAMLAYATTNNPIELINAFVDPGQRGTGVGKALVEKLEQIAAQAGYTEIIVNSGPRYKDSGWAFWTRQYGDPVEIQKDLYGPGGDAPVWKKLLRPEQSASSQ